MLPDRFINGRKKTDDRIAAAPFIEKMSEGAGDQNKQDPNDGITF